MCAISPPSVSIGGGKSRQFSGSLIGTALNQWWFIFGLNLAADMAQSKPICLIVAPGLGDHAKIHVQFGMQFPRQQPGDNLDEHMRKIAGNTRKRLISAPFPLLMQIAEKVLTEQVA